MISLPKVTLICLTNKDFEGHKKALDKSCEQIQFGAVKLIWDEKITDINEWNRKIIYQLPRYIDTDFALLIHADGYVINPDLWNPDWLNYDYIGAPWPLPRDNYSYKTPSGKLIRVGNSVSLRSKKLMDLVASRPMEYHYGNNNEDGQICVWERDWLEEQGCKFAPLEVAVYFSKEHEIEENKNLRTFMFHEVDI
jgi:hypothetical protein